MRLAVTRIWFVSAAEQKSHIWNTTHLSSFFISEKALFRTVSRSLFSELCRRSPPFSSSFSLSSLSLTPWSSFPSFFSLFKPFVLFFLFFLRLALDSWVMIVVKYGLGLFFTPSVYRAWVFLKADKMKEPFFPLIVCFSAHHFVALPTLPTFPASFSSSIIVLWIFILPPLATPSLFSSQLMEL